MRRILVFIAMSCAAIGLHPQANSGEKGGIFGLSPHMTRADLIKLVGKDAVVEDLAGSLKVREVPLKSEYFDTYICSFDKNDRLSRILASSKPIRTKDGENLRDLFDNLRIMLEEKYGKLLFVTGGKRSKITWADAIGRPGHEFMRVVG
jgi:hypothetical protein